MSDKPIFVYAATHSSTDDAWSDFEVLLELHAEKLVGTYDVAVINKDEEGKVHVHKHAKASQQGAWGGTAVGALCRVLFAPSVRGAATIGVVVGGLDEHFREGLSRADLKELGEAIQAGEASLVLIGNSRVKEQLDKPLARAETSIEKEVDADGRNFERDLEEAEEQLVRREPPRVSSDFSCHVRDGRTEAARQSNPEAGLKDAQRSTFRNGRRRENSDSRVSWTSRSKTRRRIGRRTTSLSRGRQRRPFCT